MEPVPGTGQYGWDGLQTSLWSNSAFILFCAHIYVIPVNDEKGRSNAFPSV